MAAVTVEDLVKPRMPTLSPRRLTLVSKGLCEWGREVAHGLGTLSCAVPCHAVPIRATPS